LSQQVTNLQHPQALTALDQCWKQKVIRIIAKLDRLRCNVAFMANLKQFKAGPIPTPAGLWFIYWMDFLYSTV
jgi:hypothetical protein